MVSRQKFRSLRNELSLNRQEDNALQVSDQIVHRLFFLKAKNIGFYLANDSELDASPLMAAAFSLKKKCFLPRVTSRHEKNSGTWLKFQHYDAFETRLRLGRYGIPEPEYNPSTLIRSCMLDLVFIPLVAFDATGSRMGMGKGYYDRTFAKNRLRWRQPLMVGLAHSVQETAHLQRNVWDVPMDMIVTESQFLSFKNT